jgi:hypothetical protein
LPTGVFMTSFAHVGLFCGWLLPTSLKIWAFLLGTYHSTLPWQLSHVHVSINLKINYLINSEIFILKIEIFLKIQHFLSINFFLWIFFWVKITTFIENCIIN